MRIGIAFKVGQGAASPARTVDRWFDGNGNVEKVSDFKGTVTNYVYNALNQRASMGWGANDDDITYTWGCCRVTAYTDATGSASLSYDQLSRLTGFTDTQGNRVQYQYDAVGRVTRVTDHTGATVSYDLDKYGAMVSMLTPRGTTYFTYDSAGRTATKLFPNEVRASYSYEIGGRVSQILYEDVRDPNNPVTLQQYDFAYTGLSQRYTRTENSVYRLTFVTDRMNRLTQEKKEDVSVTPAVLHYQKDFSYDKAGNRTRYKHQNGSGMGQYGQQFDYNSWSYDAMGRLTQIRDTARGFTATVSSDWNGNITSVREVIPNVLDVTSWFSYDEENRLVELSLGGTGLSVEHVYDGLNRLISTNTYVGQNAQSFQHIYSGMAMLGSIEVTDPQQPVVGKGFVWDWVSAVGYETVEGPLSYSTSSNAFFRHSDEIMDARATYDLHLAAGDTKDQSRIEELLLLNSGTPLTRVALVPSPSELFVAFNYSIVADNVLQPSTHISSRYALSELAYIGTRVYGPVIGRDLNPLGRGNGTYYHSGSQGVWEAKPPLIGDVGFGVGNSINDPGRGDPGAPPDAVIPPPPGHHSEGGNDGKNGGSGGGSGLEWKACCCGQIACAFCAMVIPAPKPGCKMSVHCANPDWEAGEYYQEKCCECMEHCSLEIPPYSAKDCAYMAGRVHSAKDWAEACLPWPKLVWGKEPCDVCGITYTNPEITSFGKAQKKYWQDRFLRFTDCSVSDQTKIYAALMKLMVVTSKSEREKRYTNEGIPCCLMPNVECIREAAYRMRYICRWHCRSTKEGRYYKGSVTICFNTMTDTLEAVLLHELAHACGSPEDEVYYEYNDPRYWFNAHRYNNCAHDPPPIPPKRPT